MITRGQAKLQFQINNDKAALIPKLSVRVLLLWSQKNSTCKLYNRPVTTSLAEFVFQCQQSDRYVSQWRRLVLGVRVSY